MKLRPNLFIVVLAIFCFCCSKKNEPEVSFRTSTDGLIKIKTIRFSDDHVPETRVLDGRELGLTDLMSSPISMVYNGKYLIVTDMNDNSFFHVIDPSNGEYIKTLGQKGFGPNEIMTSMYSLSLSDDSKSGFWSYDLQQRRFSKFSINSEDSSRLPEEQYTFKAADFTSMKVSWTDDKKLLGLAMDGESRFTKYDRSGVELARFGDYDDLFNNRYSKGVLGQLYQGMFRANPENNKFLHSSIYVDQLEIFDLRNKELIEIIGPLGIDPIFKEASVQGYPVLDIDVNETYNAYLDGFFGNEKVYGLFSGKKWNGSPQGKEVCTELYVFNIEGEVLEKIVLEQEIRSFTIDEENGILYGITLTENPDIIEFKLSQ